MNSLKFGRSTVGLLGIGLIVVGCLAGAPEVTVAQDTSPVMTSPESVTNPIRESSVYVGLYYPGLTLGYQGNRFSLELRGSSQNDIQLLGGRYSHYVYPYRGGNLYWGLDGYHVTFEDVIVEGDGYMGGLFGGFQTYLGSSLSFTIDGGPYYVTLDDEVSGLTSEGLQFVVNTGINIHF